MSKKRLTIKVDSTKVSPKDTVLVSRSDSTVKARLSKGRIRLSNSQILKEENEKLKKEIVKLKIDKK